MSDTTNPTDRRWAVTPAQLTAAVVASGVKPTKNSPLPHPDAAAASGATAAGPLGSASDVMGVLADPVGRFTLVIDGPGRVGRAAPAVYWGDIAGPFVLVVETQAGLELEVLPKLNDVALFLDRTLQLTMLPARTSGASLDLSIAAYGALLAVADAVEEDRLRHLLDRSTESTGALPWASVVAAFDAGVANDHPDWAVSAALAVCPADLAAARPKLGEGLRDLVQAGIVDFTNDHVAVTAAGLGLVASLMRPLRTAGVARSVAGADDAIGVAHLTVHRGAAGLWLALWTAIAENPGCTLIECSGQQANVTLMDLIRR